MGAPPGGDGKAAKFRGEDGAERVAPVAPPNDRCPVGVAPAVATEDARLAARAAFRGSKVAAGVDRLT